MKRILMTPILVLSFVLSVVTPLSAAASAVTTIKVELPVIIHFLSAAGDDVEVGPGAFHLEPAESWLKLQRAKSEGLVSLPFVSNDGGSGIKNVIELVLHEDLEL